MSEEPGFIVKFYDKAYEKKDIIDLLNSPVDAISGVTRADAEKLEKAFNIKTVADLATNEYVRLAQAVTNFTECTGQILDKKFQSKEFIELAEKPVNAINGISEGDAKLLKQALNIKSIKDLARNKYVNIAQTTISLAALLEVLVEMMES